MAWIFDYSVLLFAALFVALFLAIELGRWLGNRSPDGGAKGGSIVDGAIFALFGLLLAFTFSGAANRFDQRRQLIVAEANAIGTAYLRIDVAPEAQQTKLRQAFHRYAQSRIDAYVHVADDVAFKAALDSSAQIQTEIWSLAVAAGADPAAKPTVNGLLLPALNEMIDITTTRYAATLTHPPGIIFAMLVGLALVCATLAGHAMTEAKSRDWIHVLGFAAVVTLAIYVIVDLEHPRRGFIRVDGFDQLLKDAVGQM